nr:hypothetical protein [Tanacetum cinerariifolium]
MSLKVLKLSNLERYEHVGPKSLVHKTSAKVKTVNNEVRIQALVDGKRVNIKESSIRHILMLDDAKGTSCLTNADIFEGLARMGTKTTSWNEFSSTMASAIICLATNQKFNFLRVGTRFSGVVTLLFDNMLVQAPEEVGILQADAQPMPISTEPSTSKPQKKYKPKRKHTQEPEEKRVLKELKSVHSIVDSNEPVTEKEKSSKQGKKTVDIDADVQINLEKAQAEAYNLDLDNQEKVLSMLDVNDEEPADVEEVLEVVKVAKLKTEVVTTAGVDVNAASVQDTLITTVEATKVSVPRKRRGVIIQDHEEVTTTVTMKPKVNEGIKVPEQEVRQEKEVEIESSKREGKILEQEIAKKQKMEQETEEFKKHLQIIPDDDDELLWPQRF